MHHKSRWLDHTVKRIRLLNAMWSPTWLHTHTHRPPNVFIFPTRLKSLHTKWCRCFFGLVLTTCFTPVFVACIVNNNINIRLAVWVERRRPFSWKCHQRVVNQRKVPFRWLVPMFTIRPNKSIESKIISRHYCLGRSHVFLYALLSCNLNPAVLFFARRLWIVCVCVSTRSSIVVNYLNLCQSRQRRRFALARDLIWFLFRVWANVRVLWFALCVAACTIFGTIKSWVGRLGGGPRFQVPEMPARSGPTLESFFFFIIIFESVIYIRVGFFFFKNKRQKRNVDRLIDVDMWANNMRWRESKMIDDSVKLGWGRFCILFFKDGQQCEVIMTKRITKG